MVKSNLEGCATFPEPILTTKSRLRTIETYANNEIFARAAKARGAATCHNNEYMRAAFFVRPALGNDWTAMRFCFRDSAKAAWADFLPEEVLKKLEAPDRWKDNIYTRSLENGVLVLEAEAMLVGFAVIRPSEDEDAERFTGEIDAFYVEPKFWGRGGGRSLMEACVQQMKDARYLRATLWTEERNTRACKFYELQGWRADGTKRTRSVHGTDITEIRYLLDW